MAEQSDDYLRDSAVYVISVAAELAGMHPQTLRQYDRLGLVSPKRTRGRGRRYSRSDIDALLEVQRLSQDDGVNLAGIGQILELQRENARLKEQNRRLKSMLVEAQRVIDAIAQRRDRMFAASASGDIFSYRRDRDRQASDGSAGELVPRRRQAVGRALVRKEDAVTQMARLQALMAMRHWPS